MIEVFKRPLSLVEATMEGIRSSIINGELSLGQQLTESSLQKSFGFSKTPITEALALLKSEGLVESEVHKGFRVFQMDEKELSEFCELRLALESQALSSAYKNNRLELVRKLEIFINEMKESIKNNDYVKYNLMDTKYHKSFFILSSNRFLLKHYENISSIIETIRTHYHSRKSLFDKDKLTFSNSGHISIHEHIESKNLSLALHELEKHINSWFDDRIIKSGLTL